MNEKYTIEHIVICPDRLRLRTYIAVGSMSTFFFDGAETFFLDILDLCD